MKNPSQKPWSLLLMAIGSHQLLQVMSALVICSIGLLRFQLPQLAYYFEPIVGSPAHWWQTLGTIATNLIRLIF